MGIAHATTVNIDWLMDGSTYAQTTCETGGNFALPSPTPTKYGYHFVGWQQNDAIGSWSQSGTPTPTNPIEPTFRQFGNTVLRAIGSGDNFIADSYDPTTGKITRRVGVKVLDGTEDYTLNGSFLSISKSTYFPGASLPSWSTNIISTHFPAGGAGSTNAIYVGSANVNFTVTATFPTTTDWTNWLKAQYNAGTPVTIYYPLATPVEENYNAQ